MKNKIAMITGGTRGIGFATARALALRGAIPIITYLSNDQEADLAVSELKTLNKRAEARKFNIADSAEVTEHVREIVEQYGQIDFLINNAGITHDKYLFMMSKEEWDDVIDINLLGVIICTQAIAPYMKELGQGKIVNVASVGGIRPNAGQTNYAASKAGVIEYTRLLAKELIADQVRVNGVAPGFIQTPMVEKMPAKIRKKYVSNIPQGRMGDPAEVADAILFLLSEHANYMVGQTLLVDGGLSL